MVEIIETDGSEEWRVTFAGYRATSTAFGKYGI